MTAKERKICLGLLALFKIDGSPVSQLATEGELEIFYEIVFRKNKRVEINCSTQYGKSLFVALACIIVTCMQNEMIVIVAPTSEKAKIIMRYYIQHLGDSPNFYKCLEKNTKLERLQLEENKERIMLNNGGGIFVLSAQAKDSQKGFTAAMGEGAKNVILDEAALIPDLIEATIFRMIAGKGSDAFYCKIGNPFYRNHFLTTWNDPAYKKIFIDYEQGLREGRYNQAFIEEAKKKPYFDVLFGCKFPPEDMIDIQGYIRLFPDELITSAQRVVVPFGEKRLGVDIAEGGGDSNAFVLRTVNYAKVLLQFQAENTMTVPGQTIQLGKEHDIFDQNWFIDGIGVGKGSVDRLTEQNYRPYQVKFSESADDDQQYANKRAEDYYRLFQWLKEGGSLEPSSVWQQLSWIKYKVDSAGRIQLQPKIEMRKQGLPSPDVVDSLAMTFDRKSVINKSREEIRKEKELLKQFDFNRKNIRGGTAYQRR